MTNNEKTRKSMKDKGAYRCPQQQATPHLAVAPIGTREKSQPMLENKTNALLWFSFVFHCASLFSILSIAFAINFWFLPEIIFEWFPRIPTHGILGPMDVALNRHKWITKLKFESQFESPTPGVHVVQGTTVSIRGCIASKPFFRILLAPLPMSLVGRIADDKYFLVLATSAFTWRFSFWAWFASMLSSLPTAFSTALVLDSPSANNCVTNNPSRRTFVSDRTPLSVTVATSIRLSYMLSHGNLFVIIGLRSSSEMILSLSTPWYSTGDFQNSSNIFWVLVEVLQHLSSNIWAFVEKTLALQLHMETTN